jgi:hypothetical protein
MAEKRVSCSMGLRGKIGVASNKEALFHPEAVVWEQGGVYVTRIEQKAAWYSGKHFTNIIGLQRGYKAPCRYDQSCTVAQGRIKAENLIMAEETTKHMRAETAQEKKEPIYQAPSHEATGAVCGSKTVGRRGSNWHEKWGSSSTERRGSSTKHQQQRMSGVGLTNALLCVCSFVQCAAIRSMLMLSRSDEDIHDERHQHVAKRTTL